MARSDEFPPLACCVTPMLIALYLKYYQTRERYGKYRAFMKGKAVAQLCNQLKEQHGGSSTPLLNMSTTRDGQGVWSTGWTQHGLDREQSLSRGHWMRLYALLPEPLCSGAVTQAEQTAWVTAPVKTPFSFDSRGLQRM